MNEFIFFLHIFVITGFTLGALRLGQEALVALLCVQSLLSNLFVIKQITLFGLDVTSTDVFAVGGIIGLNLLQEYFGKSIAIKAITINFFVLIFYLMMTQFHLWYQPNVFDIMHHHFTPILTPMLRITIASLTVYAVVQMVDTYLYRFLKNRFAGKYLLMRSVISLTCTQFLDTVLFSFAGLYGIVESMTHIIIVSFIIKMIVIALSSPCITLSKFIMKSPAHERI